MANVVDLYGEAHTVTAWIDPEHGRHVQYDLDPYTPEQAYALARQLLAAADALTNTLISLGGSAS